MAEVTATSVVSSLIWIGGLLAIIVAVGLFFATLWKASRPEGVQPELNDATPWSTMSWKCRCGCAVDDGRKICGYCGTSRDDPAHLIPVDTNLQEMRDEVAATTSCVVLGVLAGGIFGFLLRPSVPLLGVKLPLEVVVTRGSTLTGMDTLFRGLAETSFNYLVVGIVAGGTIGYFVSKYLQPAEAGSTRTGSGVSVTVSFPQPRPTDSQVGGSFCHACGMAMPSIAVFCPGCGAKRI